MAGEAVITMIAKISDVVDTTAGRDHLYQWTIHSIQGDISAQRVDFHVPVPDVRESDRAIKGLHVNMSPADIPEFHAGTSPLEGHVSTKLLHPQRAGTGVQCDTTVARNKDLVIDASGLSICAGKQVRLKFNPVAREVVINFDFV